MSWTWFTSTTPVEPCLRAAGGVQSKESEPTHRKPKVSSWTLGDTAVRVIADHRLGVEAVGVQGPCPPALKAVLQGLDAHVQAAGGEAPLVRLAATRALAYAAPDWFTVAAVWPSLLDDGSEAVRRAAVRVAQQRRWTSAAPLLRDLAARDPQLAEVARWAAQSLEEAV